MLFCNSKKGFTIKVTFSDGTNRTTRCKKYKAVLQTVLMFMNNSNVRAIRIWNNETEETQLITEAAWK